MRKHVIKTWLASYDCEINKQAKKQFIYVAKKKKTDMCMAKKQRRIKATIRSAKKYITRIKEVDAEL